MANNKDFVVKNGLTVGGQTVITESRELSNIVSLDTNTLQTLIDFGLGGGVSEEDAIVYAIALG